jgi:tetratricopeptide (TPR) repeat protein
MMKRYRGYVVFIICICVLFSMAACNKPIQPTAYSGMKSEISEEAKTFNASGLSFAQDGQYEKAIEVYKKAIAKEPAYAEAYVNCSKAYYATGNYDMARYYNMKGKEILESKATVIRESETETDEEL